MVQVLIAVVVTLIIAATVTWFLASAYHKKVSEAKIGSAEDKAREIIDEALKTAETKKRESLLEVKEESIRTKNELDKEIKERRAEAQRYERRVQQKEEAIDKKSDAIEKKEAGLAAREEELAKQREEISKLNEQRIQELERISGLTSEQAKEYLLKIVEDEVKHETAVMIKEMESRAKEEADKKAKEYVVNAIQKCAADHVSETTISVVQLPNDEMKGRIIGREGRNIRTLETLTGVDLIIDDTPEAVILSGFDPIRREVARIALEKLIVDGRIHPARIEEMVEKAQKEVEVMIKDIHDTKIALSLKFPETNPWANAAEDYAVGTVITGKVARMTDFGAFVELAPGVDALLHVSQISKEHVEKPSDVLKVGQEIEAKIVDFNEEEKKISLSMKALLAPEEDADADVADVDIDAVAKEEE